MSTFKKDVFDRKVSELMAMSKDIQYVPAELKRSDDWTAGPKGLRRKDGKFFKVLMVRVTRPDGSSWIQPFLIEEGNQYDRAQCFRTVGNIVLPVRWGRGGPMVGLTVVNGPGSCGEPTICAPRASLSNPDQVNVPGSGILWHRKVFSNVNRIGGRIAIYVALEQSDAPVKAEGSVVWFSLDELPHLMDHELMCDPPTLALVGWVLANREEVWKKALPHDIL